MDDDIYVYLVDLPGSVAEMVAPCCGGFTIYLKDLYVDELIDMETYKADLERYRAEIAVLEVPAERDTSAIEALLQMNTYEIYQTLDKAQKRRLWQSVIKSITPQPDRSFFVEYL